MIATADELVEFSRRLGARFPSLRSRLVLEEPGCSRDEIQALEKVAEFPSDYLELAARFDLTKVTWGAFQLHPRFRSPSGDGDLPSRLRFTNFDKGNPLVGYLRTNQLVEVGAREVDPIALALRESSWPRGSVVSIQIALGPESRTITLANDFLHFLLLVANLTEVALLESDRTIENFRTRRAALGATAEQAAAWDRIAEADLL